MPCPTSRNTPVLQPVDRGSTLFAEGAAFCSRGLVELGDRDIHLAMGLDGAHTEAQCPRNARPARHVFFSHRTIRAALREATWR